MNEKHPTDEELLLLQGGELERPRRDVVQQHVYGCLRCRAELEDLGEFFSDVRGLNTKKLEEAVEGSPTETADRVSGSRAKQRWNGKRWLAAGMAVTVAVAVTIFVWNDSSAEAAELLSKAAAAQPTSQNGAYYLILESAGLRCAVEGRKATDNPWQYRAASQSPQTCNTIQQNLIAVGWGWEDLLSARSLRAWHARLTDKRDSIRRSDGYILLTTTTHSSALSEAALRMRSSDYQPVSGRLIFEHQAPIEIAASANQPVELASVQPQRSMAATVPVPGSDQNSESSRPSIPALDPLDAAEISVRVALHHLGLDSGYETEVRRRGGEVEVLGLVATEAEKTKIEAALSGMRNVQVSIWTDAEFSIAPNRPAISFPDVEVTGSAPPLAEKEMARIFPNQDAENGFKNQVMNATRDLLGHATVLRDLELLYKKAQNADLEAVLRDHQSRVRTDLANLAGNMAPIAGPVATPAQSLQYADVKKLVAALYQLIYRSAGDNSVSLEERRELVRKLLSQ